MTFDCHTAHYAGLPKETLVMPVPHRINIAATLAAVIVALPLSSAKAQYYYSSCSFPLEWPFCIAGAAVGAAATIATAPFRVVAGDPYYYYGTPGYYYTSVYYGPHYHHRRHHYYRHYY
jgi:hypothetical protein